MNNLRIKGAPILYGDLGGVLKWTSRIFAVSFGIGLAATIILLFGGLPRPIDDIVVVIAIPITTTLILPYLLVLLMPARSPKNPLKELIRKYPTGWPGILLRSIYALLMVASASITLCLVFAVSSALYALVGIDWVVRPSLIVVASLLGLTGFLILSSIAIGYFGSAIIHAGISLRVVAQAILRHELGYPGFFRFLRHPN